MNRDDLQAFKSLVGDNPILEKAYNELEAIYGDPAKYFYTELSQTIMALSKEMEFIRNGNKEKAIIIGSDDKTFERITKLAIDSDKIFTGLKKGRSYVDPEGHIEGEKKEGSYADRKADRSRANPK